MAENKLLRRMFDVPDDFGKEQIKEIKLADKERIEDYKIFIRQLEKEIEELEEERTQLRYRLRQLSTLYSKKEDKRYDGLTEQQYTLLDNYAQNLKEYNRNIYIKIIIINMLIAATALKCRSTTGRRSSRRRWRG